MDTYCNLTNGNYRLYIDMEDDSPEAQREKGYVKAIAEQLDAKFAAFCKTPFTVIIAEYVCESNTEHAYAAIAVVDESSNDVVNSRNGKPIARLIVKQYYAARRKTNPDENYMGRVEVEIYTYLSEGAEQEKTIEITPDIQLLIDLVFAQYYGQIAHWFTEWETDYRDSYEIKGCDLITPQ